MDILSVVITIKLLSYDFLINIASQNQNSIESLWVGFYPDENIVPKQLKTVTSFYR